MRVHNLPEVRIEVNGCHQAESANRQRQVRVLAASFYIEFVVETFLSEIAFFVGDSIVEPAMRLKNEVR